MGINADDILAVSRKVTKEWTKQRKAEERSFRARWSRGYTYSDRVNFTDVAASILPAGYARASGNGQFTVDKRQFYYQVRDEFLEKTKREIPANYFSQVILVQYMNRHPEQTASWKITASPRGTLTIPNTGHDLRIPCGTIAIEEHLQIAARQINTFGIAPIDVVWPSLREGERYQGVLYIEKEGFDPQLREANLAERFSIVIISCKGQSVVAARMYVDEVCRLNGGIPLFVAHDFDKSGFEICQRLTSVSDHAEEHDLVKYTFKNEIGVTDIGLRLTDVEKYGLKSERCNFQGWFPSDTPTTQRERDFLTSDKRVELNSFTAPQFIEWLETALRKKGLTERFIPQGSLLADPFRRALVIAELNGVLKGAMAAAIEKAKIAKIPKNLRQQIQKSMKAKAQPWDMALYELAQKTLVCESDEDA